MKKILAPTIIIFYSVCSFGQTVESLEKAKVKQHNSLFPLTYQLFPTENRWTFLKLNTRNGKIWQVQYDTQGDNRFESFLNLLPLVEEEEEVDNRFTLYPTENIWTFILLDQINGNIWQVQWSIEPENRGIWFIN